MAVYAKTQADEDKLGVALARVTQEDPTIRVERNKETRQTLISGLGDVHIEVAVELMKNRSNADVTLAEPKIPYHETVTAVGEGHYKHKKQSGGRGQYGEVYLRVMPMAQGEEEWFIDKVVGGTIPGNFLPAVQKGLVEGMQAGALARYPVTGIKVEVYDGSYHDVDSSEIAFKIAGARALKDGMLKARPVLLEPVMKVRVTIPDQYMGDINGDLNHKRGRILGINPEEGMQAVTGEVPQAEIFRYAAELRSMTAGQGSFEMQFSRYEVVPGAVAQKIVAAAEKNKAKEKED
jgi:elongation factor G